MLVSSCRKSQPQRRPVCHPQTPHPGRLSMVGNGAHHCLYSRNNQGLAHGASGNIRYCSDKSRRRTCFLLWEQPLSDFPLLRFSAVEAAGVGGFFWCRKLGKLGLLKPAKACQSVPFSANPEEAKRGPGWLQPALLPLLVPFWGPSANRRLAFSCLGNSDRSRLPHFESREKPFYSQKRKKKRKKRKKNAAQEAAQASRRKSAKNAKKSEKEKIRVLFFSLWSSRADTADREIERNRGMRGR